MVRIKFFSDVHEDVNGSVLARNFQGCSADWDVALIAGDIAGSISATERFLDKYMKGKTVYFANGNHQVYNKENKTIQQITKEYREKFPLGSGNWHYLENNYAQIDSHVYVIGAVFYTDYMIGGKKLQKKHMINGFFGLNDFRMGSYDVKGERVELKPEHYLEMHKKSKKEIKRLHDEIVAKDPDAKIILMTHHCLSLKCVARRWETSSLNASYASKLERWVINDLPNVVIVNSGHVHDCADFEFGRKRRVRYIINPVGYCAYYEDCDYNKEKILEIK